MSKRCIAILWFLTLPGSAVVKAQSTTATISGVVKDASSAVLPEAAVTVKNLETGITREIVTDDQGRYRVTSLSLGSYEVQASLPGFQTEVRTGITLTMGREALVDFSLKVGELTERLVITGEAPLSMSPSAKETPHSAFRTPHPAFPSLARPSCASPASPCILAPCHLSLVPEECVSG